MCSDDGSIAGMVIGVARILELLDRFYETAVVIVEKVVKLVVVVMQRDVKARDGK